MVNYVKCFTEIKEYTTGETTNLNSSLYFVSD